jgi:3-oxoacyl-[acyl-carrier-protein] synthase II
MIEQTHTELMNKGARRISPFFVPASIINMISGHVSIKFGFKGPNIAVVTACTTGLHAIGLSARMIEYGDCDVMVAGGAEATISPLGLGGFASARALSTRNDDPKTASRPWDKDRDGFVLGEGGGVLVLEEYEHAKARGAKIYAELIGFGMSGDAYHMTTPDEDGPRRSMVMALKNAGVNADEVQYLNAHGTSTPLGDLNETNAIKAAFGEQAKNLVVSSTKSMTGHLLGGAGCPCITKKFRRPSTSSIKIRLAILITAPIQRVMRRSRWLSKITLVLVVPTVLWCSSGFEAA